MNRIIKKIYVEQFALGGFAGICLGILAWFIYMIFNPPYYNFLGDILFWVFVIGGYLIIEWPTLLDKILKEDIDYFGIRRARKELGYKRIILRNILRMHHLLLGWYEYGHSDKEEQKERIEEINTWTDNEMNVNSEIVMKWAEQKLPMEMADSRESDILAQYERILKDNGIDKESVTIQNVLDCSKSLIDEFTHN